MDEDVALIGQIIGEHKLIIQKVRTLEGVTNDLSAMLELEKAEEDFVLGRFSDQRQALQSWQEAIEAVDQGLQAHFEREETGVLTIFEKHGGGMLASALHILLHEHEELKNRIAKLKKDAAELATGELSREVWEGKVWGIRSYIGRTRKLIEAHARSEMELLQTLRSRLQRGNRGE